MKQNNKKDQNVKPSEISIKYTPASLTTNNISLPLEEPILKKKNIEVILEVLGNIRDIYNIYKYIITYNNINNNNNIFL